MGMQSIPANIFDDNTEKDLRRIAANRKATIEAFENAEISITKGAEENKDAEGVYPVVQLIYWSNEKASLQLDGRHQEEGLSGALAKLHYAIAGILESSNNDEPEES